MFAIRPYHPSDFCALYRVCLLTGDSGSDASSIYQNPELLGHIYVGPYLVLEPDVCFTLTNNGAPVGYVLGARDTAVFHARCERDWYPVLRARYPLPAPDDSSPDAGLIRHIHTVPHEKPEWVDYPAHLHIDLLPEAQGQGMGRRMIETLLDRLREVGAPGVHLGVSAKNTRAIQFYAHVGFHQIKASAGGITFGMRLS
jgi:GNAT superfamily N-acetyltransferase